MIHEAHELLLGSHVQLAGNTNIDQTPETSREPIRYDDERQFLNGDRHSLSLTIQRWRLTIRPI